MSKSTNPPPRSQNVSVNYQKASCGVHFISFLPKYGFFNFFLLLLSIFVLQILYFNQNINFHLLCFKSLSPVWMNCWIPVTRSMIFQSTVFILHINNSIWITQYRSITVNSSYWTTGVQNQTVPQGTAKCFSTYINDWWWGQGKVGHAPWQEFHYLTWIHASISGRTQSLNLRTTPAQPALNSLPWVGIVWTSRPARNPARFLNIYNRRLLLLIW